jgi:trans-2,3-dihydro-3-hydroxyanthranilate isomerase
MAKLAAGRNCHPRARGGTLESGIREATMTSYRYYTCDVFTDTRFGGNPLAVLPDAAGLSDERMQRIAREFNFSETSFVFPAESGHTRTVRIFTPAREVPFAGHPNVGTAFVLATIGALGEIRDELTVTFEEQAGLVAVLIRSEKGRVTSCELAAPQRLSLGDALPVPVVAAAVSLESADVVVATHEPQVASVGLPFVITELRNRAALERARFDLAAADAVAARAPRPSLYVYTREAGDFDVRARMFAPLSGVSEDPATGSASCALAGLLAHHGRQASGEFRWRIAQGVEMGRPSTLVARARTKDGVVTGTWVGGPSVLVTEGSIHLD